MIRTLIVDDEAPARAKLQRWLSEQPAPVANWVRNHGFQAERHRVLAYPGADGGIGGAVAGLGSLR